MLKYEIKHLGLLSKDCVLCCLNTYFFKSFCIDLFQYKTVSEESQKKKTLTKDCKVIRVSSNGLAKDNFSFSGKPYGV